MRSSATHNQNFLTSFQNIRLRRGLAFGLILIGALIAFEIFNYSTTEYALADLLGDLSFIGIPWATILAIAFCGIDFAGIARLHTPEDKDGTASETWYLFGAWLLAATMNAMLTWWGVSLALVTHESLGTSVVDRSTLMRVVPIFVAILVWLVRVLIIGTYSTAGTRLLSQQEQRTPSRKKSLREVAEGNNGRSVNGSFTKATQINNNPQYNNSRFASSENNSTSSTEMDLEEQPQNYSRREPVYTPVLTANSSAKSKDGQKNPYPNQAGGTRSRTF